MLGLLDVTESCPNSAHLPKQYIIYPYYPSDNPKTHNCSWTIVAPKEKYVELKFPNFTFDNFSEDCNDFVDIFNVLNGQETIINRYCASNKPPDHIWSDGNEVKINFHSGELYHIKSFRIEYKSIQPGKLLV